MTPKVNNQNRRFQLACPLFFSSTDAAASINAEKGKKIPPGSCREDATTTTASEMKVNKDQRTCEHVPTNDRAGHGSGIFLKERPHNRVLRRRQRCASHPDFEGAEGDAPPITTFATGAWKARPGLQSQLIVEEDHIS